MAMSVVYGSFCGMLVHEDRGGVQGDYVPDMLGSVAAVVDDTGATVYSAEYWPYGEVRTETGTNPSQWSFGGLLGYFRDILSKLLYVRARLLTPDAGQWLSTDPLWPRQPPYEYCSGGPTYQMDASGMFAWIPVACAAACGGCLVCLGAYLWQCHDCGTDANCWEKCIVDIWNNLPWWVKALCGLACGTCIACLIAVLAQVGFWLWLWRLLGLCAKWVWQLVEWIIINIPPGLRYGTCLALCLAATRSIGLCQSICNTLRI